MAGTRNVGSRPSTQFKTRLRDYTQGPRGPSDPRSYRALMQAGAPQTAGDGLDVSEEGKYVFSPGTDTLAKIVGAASDESLQFAIHEQNTRGKRFVFTDVDYTVGDDEYLVLASAGIGGDFTVTLPLVLGQEMREIVIKRLGGEALITVSAQSGEEIDGGSTVDLTSQWDSVTVICAGSKWYLI